MQPLLGYRPLAFSSLTIFEPAVTIANKVKMAMLGPPFNWRWNRIASGLTFNCNPSQSIPTDYPESVANFGWIEQAFINDLGTPSIWRPMQKVEGMAIANEQDLPRAITAQYDNGAGQITFRLMPSPDQAYPVLIDIQQKCTLFNPASSSVLTATWAPIPDEYSDLYTWGFEAGALALNGDPRFGEYNQKFVNGLLARHGGLTETQISDFLNTWMGTAGGLTLMADRLQQAVQARQV